MFRAEKKKRVLEYAVNRGIALSDCSFYSDSIYDLPLLEAVGRAVAVNPDFRLRRLARSPRMGGHGSDLISPCAIRSILPSDVSTEQSTRFIDVSQNPFDRRPRLRSDRPEPFHRDGRDGRGTA